MKESFTKLIILGLTLLGIVAGNREFQLLPRLTLEIQKAQLRLLQESKASKWGKPVDVFK